MAVLTDADDAASGISGATISFSGDGKPLGTAVTDTTGRAELALPGPYRGKGHNFAAAFDGEVDPYYRSSTATASR